MSRVYKSLQPKDVKTTPFQAYKSFSATFLANGLTTLDGCKYYETEYDLDSSFPFQYPGHTNLDQGSPVEEAKFDTTTDGYFKTVMHQQLDKVYYRDYLSNNSATVCNTNINYQYRDIGHSAFVISCANRIVGEGILPTSLLINAGGGLKLVDDGYGNVVVSGSALFYDGLAFSTTFNKYYKFIDEPTGSFYDRYSYGSCRLQSDIQGVTFEKANVDSTVGAVLENSYIGLYALEDPYVRRILNFSNGDFAIAFGVNVGAGGTFLTKRKPTDNWSAVPGGGAAPNTTPPNSYPYNISFAGATMTFTKTDGSNTLSFNRAVGGGYVNCVLQRTGSKLEFYAGGALVGAQVTDPWIGTSGCNSSDVLCGNTSDLVLGNNYDRTDPFEGSVSYLHMFNRSLAVSEIQQLHSNKGALNNYCGNVFYEHGIIALTQPRAVSTGKSIVNLQYRSTVTLLETQAFCTVGPGDFNRTYNKTTHTWNPLTNRLETACRYTGSFRPYVTTVGLYDDFNNLIAVGKLSTPVQTSRTTDTTFVVKFDR